MTRHFCLEIRACVLAQGRPATHSAVSTERAVVVAGVGRRVVHSASDEREPLGRCEWKRLVVVAEQHDGLPRSVERCCLVRLTADGR
eukprot:5164519-Pleurochrysis_carterae.AAC.1